MIWAGIVACVAIFGLLLAAQGMFASLRPLGEVPRASRALRVGALDWSLFSGMEVALYLGIWAGAFHAAWSRLAEPDGRSRTNREASSSLARHIEFFGNGSSVSGVSCLVVTRPEGATSIAALGLLVAARDLAKRRRGTGAARCWCGRACPRSWFSSPRPSPTELLTGEFSASGAIVEVDDLQSVHDRSREVRRVSLPPQVRDLPQHRVSLHRRAALRVSRYGARRGTSVFPAHARRSDRSLGLDHRLAPLGRHERAGALAERAIHDARRRLGAVARRAGRRPAARPAAAPRAPGRAIAPESWVLLGDARPAARSSRRSLSRCSSSTSGPRCATKSGSSVAPAATSAISTSSPVAC